MTQPYVYLLQILIYKGGWVIDVIVKLPINIQLIKTSKYFCKLLAWVLYCFYDLVSSVLCMVKLFCVEPAFFFLSLFGCLLLYIGGFNWDLYQLLHWTNCFKCWISSMQTSFFLGSDSSIQSWIGSDKLWYKSSS